MNGYTLVLVVRIVYYSVCANIWDKMENLYDDDDDDDDILMLIILLYRNIKRLNSRMHTVFAFMNYIYAYDVIYSCGAVFK